MEPVKRFHGAEKFWARKDRRCGQWWFKRCVIEGSQEDRLSVPCAMFDRCMYASQRDEYTPEQLEVLDAWSSARVCLIYFGDAWTLDQDTPRSWEAL